MNRYGEKFASPVEAGAVEYDPEADDRVDVTEALGQELNARMQEAREQSEYHARKAAIASAEADRQRSVVRACEAGLKSLVSDANRGEPQVGGQA